MATPGREYLRRLADSVLAELLRSLPAVLVVGPRAAGKTTSARLLAGDVLWLDRPAEAAAADPDAALVGLKEPALVDEWQEVPAILGAVKRWTTIPDQGGFCSLAAPGRPVHRRCGGKGDHPVAPTPT